MRNNCELDNRVIPRNTGGRTLRIVYTIILSPRQIIVRGVPSVLSIGGLVSLLGSVNIRMRQLGTASCTFATGRLSRGFVRDSRFLLHYTGLHNSIVLVNPLLTHLNRSHCTGPNNSGVNHHHLSARFVKVGRLKTRLHCGGVAKTCRISTGSKLANYCVLLSRTSMANATGVIVTTIGTGNMAAVCGTTYRPCLRRLYAVLGDVNTGVSNINSGLLAVRNIRGLSNYARHVLPSVVRINDFVNVTTVAHDRVAVGGASCHGLNVVPRTFHHLNVIIRRHNSSVFVPHRRRCRVRSFFSKSVLAVTSTP